MALRNATVTVSTIGVDAGPFTITDGLGQTYSGISRATLLAGYTNIFDDTAVNITVTSAAPCGTVLVIPVVTPTPQPTIPPPTPTPTSNLLTISVHLDVTPTCPGGVVNRRIEDGTLAEGKTLYLNDGVTPVTGFNYVVDGAGGFIYNLDPVSGVVGASTGTAC